MLIDALSALCAQLTRDLFAIAKFLLIQVLPLKLFTYTTLPFLHYSAQLIAVAFACFGFQNGRGGEASNCWGARRGICPRPRKKSFLYPNNNNNFWCIMTRFL